MKHSLMKIIICIPIILLLGCGGGSSPQTNWVLIWEDEFNEDKLDNTKWRITEQGLNYNNEDQAYIKDQVSVKNGVLTLTCAKSSWSGPTGRSDVPGDIAREYISGEINTLQSWAYGKFEIRACIPPKNQGILSAIWMTPTDNDWPPEIDIMEILGHNPAVVYFTNHYGTSVNHQMKSGNFQNSDFLDGFHTYSIEWEPGVIRWYVDGIKKFTSTAGIPDEPFILRLSLPVGPDWEGNPDNTSVFPQVFKIDWVRVYQNKN